MADVLGLQALELADSDCTCVSNISSIQTQFAG